MNPLADVSDGQILETGRLVAKSCVSKSHSLLPRGDFPSRQLINFVLCIWVLSLTYSSTAYVNVVF